MKNYWFRFKNKFGVLMDKAFPAKHFAQAEDLAVKDSKKYGLVIVEYLGWTGE